MGTNYDIKYKICSKCKRFDELHLGKSSGGWKFCLQANEFKYYKNWSEMRKWLLKMTRQGAVIRNEYNEKVLFEEFVTLVESKQKIKEPICDGRIDTDIDGYRFANYEFS